MVCCVLCVVLFVMCFWVVVVVVCCFCFGFVFVLFCFLIPKVDLTEVGDNFWGKRRLRSMLY